MADSYAPKTPEAVTTTSTFEIKRMATGRNTRGGRTQSWETVTTFRGVLASASPSEILRWAQIQHPVTHKAVVKGHSVTVSEGDRVQVGNRVFFVTGQEDPGQLGLWYVIWLDERKEA